MRRQYILVNIGNVVSGTVFGRLAKTVDVYGITAHFRSFNGFERSSCYLFDLIHLKPSRIVYLWGGPQPPLTHLYKRQKWERLDYYKSAPLICQELYFFTFLFISLCFSLFLVVLGACTSKRAKQCVAHSLYYSAYVISHQ